MQGSRLREYPIDVQDQLVEKYKLDLNKEHVIGVLEKDYDDGDSFIEAGTYLFRNAFVIDKANANDKEQDCLDTGNYVETALKNTTYGASLNNIYKLERSLPANPAEAKMIERQQAMQVLFGFEKEIRESGAESAKATINGEPVQLYNVNLLSKEIFEKLKGIYDLKEEELNFLARYLNKWVMLKNLSPAALTITKQEVDENDFTFEFDGSDEWLKQSTEINKKAEELKEKFAEAEGDSEWAPVSDDEEESENSTKEVQKELLILKKGIEEACSKESWDWDYKEDDEKIASEIKSDENVKEVRRRIQEFCADIEE